MKVVPNILSFFRICLVPVFIIAFFTDERDIKLYAIIVYGVAGLSDLLDGYIARKYEAQSKLGKFLDPLGDKMMTFAVLVCITVTRHVLIPATTIFFIKEILMGIGGLILYKKARIEMPPANFIGKASTFVFFVVCVALMVFGNIQDSVAIIMTSIAIGLTLVALAVYIRTYFKLMNSRKKNGEIECNHQSVQDVNETRQ